MRSLRHYIVRNVPDENEVNQHFVCNVEACHYYEGELSIRLCLYYVSTRHKLYRRFKKHVQPQFSELCDLYVLMELDEKYYLYETANDMRIAYEGKEFSLQKMRGNSQVSSNAPIWKFKTIEKHRALHKKGYV